MGFSVEETDCYEEITSVLFDELIWDAVTEGNVSQDDFKLKNDSIYIVCKTFKTPVAVARIGKSGGSELDFHPCVLPEYRKSHSMDIVGLMLEWVKCNVASRYVKLTCKIPTCYPHVVRFAECMGFEHEGVNRKSYEFNGAHIDQVYMGLPINKIGS